MPRRNRQPSLLGQLIGVTFVAFLMLVSWGLGLLVEHILFLNGVTSRLFCLEESHELIKVNGRKDQCIDPVTNQLYTAEKRKINQYK